MGGGEHPVAAPTASSAGCAWTPSGCTPAGRATSIVVDVSDRSAELLEGDKVERRFAVTVGAPGSDTPLGRFAVTDTFRGDLNPAYGCCALALSATQPNLPSGWLGGSRIAIHGTTGPLGIAASHGCVRAARHRRLGARQQGPPRDPGVHPLLSRFTRCGVPFGESRWSRPPGGAAPPRATSSRSNDENSALDHSERCDSLPLFGTQSTLGFSRPWPSSGGARRRPTQPSSRRP